MKHLPTTTLIIATYKWPEALKLSLRSALAQRILPHEIIVADDGSGEDTADVIRAFQATTPIPIIHVWHEDRGFRLAEIRNKAICKATGAYIIQIDGDIILHSHFIEDHVMAAQPSTFLVGSRVLLDEESSKRAQNDQISDFNWFSGGIKNRLNAMRIPLLSGFMQASTNNATKAAYSARGCNMSFWKNDLIRVNGYDETMVGWGREDSEISARLIHAGLVKKRLKFGAIQFHLFHREHTRQAINVNDQILEKTINEKLDYCTAGLSNHC